MMRAAIAWSLLLAVVWADLPIHCVHTQVIGKWKISVGENSGDNTLSCGHQIPDRVMTMVNAKISPKNPGFTIVSHSIVDLQEPNVAIAKDGTKGTWTMVYDEGFEISLGNKKYFTFFRYEPKSSSFNQERVEDFKSFCHETVSGWYHDKDKWGCFVASKTTNVGNEEPKAPVQSSSVWMVSPTPLDDPKESLPKFRSRFRRHQYSLKPNTQMAERRSALIRPRFAGTRASIATGISTVMAQSALDDDAAFVSDINFVEMINKDVHSTWKATVHKQFQGKTMGHMAALLGRNRFHHPDPSKMSFATPKEGPLPKSLDWRDIDGGKYVTPVINQGGCGSCYAVSTADVASMRLRIKTKGKDKTILSPQHVVSCSILNQGCAGGYPFLVGKHGAEMGFVPESCQPYDGSDERCRMECYDEKIYRAKNYRYIGGYYGNCNEQAMMMELQDGPIVTAINAPGDLFYYHEGVYTGPRKRKTGEYDFSGTNKWEKTNHAVTVTGYGEEKKDGKTLKYWWIKNSWGQGWGMGGYFKMLRGEDAIAVESMPVVFEIEK